MRIHPAQRARPALRQPRSRGCGWRPRGV